MFQDTKRILITGLAATALAAPSAAYARPELNPPASSGGARPESLQVRATQPSSSQFDWADAGIGGAATVALVGAGALAVTRRRRPHTMQPS